MNTIFKKGFYILAALFISFAITSCEDDDTKADEIKGLDFVIATLNLEGTEIGVIPTTVNSNNRIIYSVDFGTTPDIDTDNVATSGPMVTFEYPNEDGAYSITVTASLQGASTVSITKDIAITEYIPPVVVTGPSNPLTGTWRIAPEEGSLSVGPGFNNSGWFSISDAQIAERACFFDDEYVFNDDGTFVNIMQGETWVEPIGDPGVACYGVSDAACGAPVFPYDGNALATYDYNAAAGTLTLDGKGAFLGLSKVINGGEVCPSAASESITYQAELVGNVLELDIQIDAGNDGWWSFKLVRDAAPSIVGTWKVAPQEGSLSVGPGFNNSGWFSISDAQIAERACFFDDEYVFNDDGTFVNIMQGETWVEPIGDPGVACYGVSDAACGAPVFPYDGNALATYDYNAAAGTLTLDGKGAFLGLSKVINGGEVCPSAASESITYQAELVGNVLELDIQIDAGNDGWWSFTLVKE